MPFLANYSLVCFKLSKERINMIDNAIIYWENKKLGKAKSNRIRANRIKQRCTTTRLRVDHDYNLGGQRPSFLEFEGLEDIKKNRKSVQRISRQYVRNYLDNE